MWGAQNFQKSRGRLKFLGARRVTTQQVQLSEPTNITRHSTEFRSHGGLTPGICTTLRHKVEF